MSVLRAVLDIFSKLFEFITGVLLTLIVLIVFYTVISSKFLGATPPWANEVPLIMVVWFGLLGAGLGVRDKSHLAVEFLVRGMGPGAKNFFFRLSYAFMLLFATAMTVAGVRLVMFTIANQQTYPATKLSVAVCYVAIPLGGAFIFLHALKHLIDLFAGRYDFTSMDEELQSEGGAEQGS